MHILSVGLSHISAPVHLRERVNFDEEQTRAALARLSCGHLANNIAEMVILSTCNRIELYAVSSAEIFTELEIFLSGWIPEPASIRRHLSVPLFVSSRTNASRLCVANLLIVPVM